MNKLKPFVTIIALVLFFTVPVKAQQVVATAGETLSGNSGSVSFTLGELAADTKTGTPGILTEGFHQPIITITSLENTMEINFSIVAYPNPTCEIVNLKIENEDLKGLSYILFDASGNYLLRNNIENSTTEISFHDLKTAVYFLRVETEGKELKTFKIIKE